MGDNQPQTPECSTSIPFTPKKPINKSDTTSDNNNETDGDITNNNNNNHVNGEDSKGGREKRVNCSSPRAPIVSPDADCASEDDGSGLDGNLELEDFVPSCNILDDVTDADENDSKRGFPVPNVADFEVKILVIGATNSGKTSLIEKYLTGSNSRARTTLCLDINKARIPFEFMGETYQLTFYIYDMAGMKKFQSHNSSYYADVFAVLFVFDITCRISLNFTINWLGDYCNFCQKQQFSPSEKILVCNKCDLPNAIMTREELMNFAQVSGMTSLFECSAKSGRNVDSLFYYIAQQFMIEKTSQFIPPPAPSDNTPTPSSPSHPPTGEQPDKTGATQNGS